VEWQKKQTELDSGQKREKRMRSRPQGSGVSTGIPQIERVAKLGENQ